MQQSCSSPNLQRVIHWDLEASVSQPQHPPHCCLLKSLQGLCPAATSAHKANKHLPAIHSDKWGLFHSLPFSTVSQSRETWSSLPSAVQAFFSPLCLYGRCRPFLHTSYLTINASTTVNACSHRARTLTIYSGLKELLGVINETCSIQVIAQGLMHFPNCGITRFWICSVLEQKYRP